MMLGSHRGMDRCCRPEWRIRYTQPRSLRESAPWQAVRQAQLKLSEALPQGLGPVHVRVCVPAPQLTLHVPTATSTRGGNHQCGRCQMNEHALQPPSTEPWQLPEVDGAAPAQLLSNGHRLAFLSFL